MEDIILNICGWAGAILILLAYALLSSKKIKDGKLYQSMNLIAAVLTAVALFPKDAWFSFTVQIIWAIIAIFALIKLAKSKA